MEAIMKMARSDLPEKLKDRRKKIDLIDRRLLKLLNQRLHVALEIGKIKKEMGEKVYDPKREKEVLRRLKIKNRGPLKEKDLEKVFRTIMKVCRRSQKGVNSRTPL
jgi:chorismate mutase/prephenate dehydratase